jgi:hypothetical protein
VQAVVPDLILSRNLPEGTVGNHEKSQSGSSVSWPKFGN